MKVKKAAKYYKLSTAQKARKWGDVCLLLGTTMTMISIETMPTWVIYTSAAFTFLGKAVTGFFTEDKIITVYNPTATDSA